ncbi:MAG: exo-alpha-sialidase [Myxococcales bacterium]|nr:exo-alpha-sialidase [Myxococcales bacterium]
MVLLGLDDRALDKLAAWANGFLVTPTAARLPVASNLARGAALFAERGCVACHAFGSRHLGPGTPAAISRKATMPALSIPKADILALRDYGHGQGLVCGGGAAMNDGRLGLVLVLAACTGAAPDTKDGLAGDSSDDSSAAGSAVAFDCSGEADPERDVAFLAILARLDAQRCLHEADILLVEAHMAEEYANATVFCDAVYRRSSADGTSFEGEPERVLGHASVPDVVITDAGEHVLVYNDVTPFRFVELLRTDPERLWRQGMLGYGGVGMAVTTPGTAVTEVLDLDLGFEQLQEAVDADLGRKPDGRWHMTWLGVRVEDMIDGRGPLFSRMPHHFFRSTSKDLHSFSAPVVAVASNEGSTGGVDPTILDLADGGEILFVSPLDRYAMGWSSSNGEVWSPALPPDVVTTVAGATADALAVGGAYRMVYMQNGEFGHFRYSTSQDGRTWQEGGTLVRTTDGFNTSVARAPDGTWWLYHNRNEPGCLDGG